MSISLTTSESRPSSTQARILRMRIDVSARIADFEIGIGRVIAGAFVIDRTVNRQFVDDSDSSDFTALVNAVPQFGQLRQAMEQYFVNTGVFAGTVS